MIRLKKEIKMSSHYDHIVCLLSFTVPVGLVYTLLFGLESSTDFIWISIIVNILATVFATTAHVACLFRFYAGSFVGEVRKRPLRQLILFDRELDPNCMPVRECLSVLDCTVEVYPIPEVDPTRTLVDLPVAQRFIEELRKRSPTKSTALPYLEDPNTQIVLQGNTSDILLYLYTTYARKGAHRSMPPPLDKGETNIKLAELACTVRSFANPYGYYAQPSAYNRKPFKLYAYEGCPYSRAVREMLTSLQLHYQLVTCAQGSTGRVQLVHHVGELVTPVLYDPETMRLLEGQEECINYLRRWYDLSAMLAECAIEMVDSNLVDLMAEPTPNTRAKSLAVPASGLPGSASSVLSKSPKFAGTPQLRQATMTTPPQSTGSTTPRANPTGSSPDLTLRKAQRAHQLYPVEDGSDADGKGKETTLVGRSPRGLLSGLPAPTEPQSANVFGDDDYDDDDDPDDLIRSGRGEEVHTLFSSASFVREPFVAPNAALGNASVADGVIHKLRQQLDNSGSASDGQANSKMFAIANDVSARLLQLGNK